MRILIIRNFPSYMDVRNNTYNIQEVGLAKALVRKGHQCDVLFWTQGIEESAKIDVDDVGSITIFYKKGFTKLKNTVFLGCEKMFEQYDILQPCEYNQIESWLLAKEYPNKTVVYHGPYYSVFNKRYNLMCSIFDFFCVKRYIKLGTRFIAKSSLAGSFLESKGINKANIKSIGVGIDAQMLATSADTTIPFYSRMKEKPDVLKILYIGRFEKRRNIPFIMDVFSEVLKQNPDAELYMVGTGEQDLLDTYFAHARKLGIKEKITWEEKIPQKYLSTIYSAADFFLLPTEYEIFGMVLLESMYYHNVVLTNQNGGSNTVIDNGENGIIMDKLVSKEWAEKILSIYNNKAKMNRIKENASNKIRNDFTWDALSDEFIKQYVDRMENTTCLKKRN